MYIYIYNYIDIDNHRYMIYNDYTCKIASKFSTPPNFLQTNSRTFRPWRCFPSRLNSNSIWNLGWERRTRGWVAMLQTGDLWKSYENTFDINILCTEKEDRWDREHLVTSCKIPCCIISKNNKLFLENEWKFVFDGFQPSSWRFGSSSFYHFPVPCSSISDWWNPPARRRPMFVQVLLPQKIIAKY